MKRNRPLSEWTLGEVQQLCKSHKLCDGCPFARHEVWCFFDDGQFEGTAPTFWDLSEETKEGTKWDR